MSIYNTPYKTGVITDINGVQMTISGDTLLNADNGRIVIITSGNARLQHRRFTRSGQVITVAHPWDTSPFLDVSRDGRTLDVMPEVGDSVVIAYNASDLVPIDTDIIDNGNNSITISAMTATTGAYIYFENYNIQLRSNTMKIGQGGGMIFGYYGYVANEDAYFENTCNIIDSTTTGTGGNQWAISPNSDYGLFDMYGVNLTINANTCFYRAYQNVNNSREVQNRWFINVYGNFGSRTDGNRSILNITSVGASSNLGVSNTRAAVSRANFSVLNNVQGAYVWLSTAGGSEGRITFDRLVNVSSHLLRVAAGSDGDGKVFEIIAKKKEVDLIPNFAEISGTSEPNHTIRYGNLVSPSYINEIGVVIPLNIKTRLYDVNLDFKQEELLNTGKYPETFIRHTDLPSNTGNYTLNDGALFAPYSLRAVSYGKVFNNTIISGEDTFSANIVLLHDNNITEPSKAVVDAYTSINNTDQFYDAAVAWLEDNVTDEEIFLSQKIGDTIDLGSYNLIIDPSSLKSFDSVGDVITINTNMFEGNFYTTGLVTGKEYISGVVIDSEQDTTLTEDNGAVFSVYPTDTDRDTKTNALAEGVTIFGTLFSSLPSITLFVAANLGGVRFPFDIVVEQGSNTFSSSIAGALGTINANLEVINQGVKKSSLIIPHTENLI